MKGSSYYPETFRGFRCLSDRTVTGDPNYGPGNYVTNSLLFDAPVRYPCRGPDGQEDPGSFSRGTANTVLYAEKYAACSFWALTSGPQSPRYIADRNSGFQGQPRACDPLRP